MNKTQTTISMLLLLAFARLASAAPAVPSAIDELSPEDQAKVQSGLQVTLVDPGQDSAWPMVRVYQRIDAIPEDAMAVFSDFGRQHEYLTDITASRLTRRIDRATVQVSYTMTTHFLLHPRENFVLRERVSSYDAGASYRLDWQLVSADDLRGDVGSARFERLGTGTLLAYSSFVTPPVIAGGESAQEIARVQATAARITERVQTTRTTNFRQLQTELGWLRAALAP